MDKASMIWILIAFVAYLCMMLVIGAAFMKKATNSEDYFLGGRGLGAWVAALSAQASDMSGWLLMGLPGAIYALGTGQSWIAIGLFTGTVFNWLCISSRLRKYTIRANNSLTLPAYFENRFHDKSKVLLTASSVVIVIFFLVYTASAFAAGGKLFSNVFGIDYKISLTIGAAAILIYTFMGGFLAVCTTDFIQGLLMLGAVLIVPIIAYILIGSGNVMDTLALTNVEGGVSGYMNLLSDGENTYSFVDIISQLGWGLGYCGMPHILTRFMAIRDEKELKKSKAIAIVWVALSLTFACVIGVIGRAYLYPQILGTDGVSSSEDVFISMITKIFTTDLAVPFIGGLFLAGILAAIMSTADSQLLVTASSVSEDLYRGVINPKVKNDKVMALSRFTVIGVAVVAYIIALDPDSSIMDLVSNAWAGLGAAFGPIVLLSLFWKRANLQGAFAGIVSGGATVILWDYIKLVDGKTLGEVTGLYSLVIGFAISVLLIFVVSLCTKEPGEEILQEFDDVVTGNYQK